MPRVVIAPDSFKGTIGAADSAACLARGWTAVRPHDEIRVLPMADGGEGTIDAFEAAVPGARRIPVTVTGPAGAPVEASWLLLPATEEAREGTAVVELASTSGIELLGRPPKLCPLDASTRGFGEAICAALGYGVSRLVLGIGSSASTDGGTGMLSALGARFVNEDGGQIVDGGRELGGISSADLSNLAPLPPGGVTVLCDVINPLFGQQGAAVVFGPQKGARPDEVVSLDAGLSNLADTLALDGNLPGAGAAGGTGYALLVWGAVIESGSAAIAELIGLSEALSGASFAVTGEGSYDGQSSAGKAPSHVAALAGSFGVPVAVVGGQVAKDADLSMFAAAVSLSELAGSAEAALAEPAAWLVRAGSELARALR